MPDVIVPVYPGFNFCFIFSDFLGGDLKCRIFCFLFYLALFPLAALLAKRIPSPARLLSVIDPLLGTGVLLQCLFCYSAGLEVFDEYMSPVLCRFVFVCCVGYLVLLFNNSQTINYNSDEMFQKFPPVQLVTGKLDPLLDDSLLFASHLKRNKTPTILHLLEVCIIVFVCASIFLWSLCYFFLFFLFTGLAPWFSWIQPGLSRSNTWNEGFFLSLNPSSPKNLKFIFSFPKFMVVLFSLLTLVHRSSLNI